VSHIWKKAKPQRLLHTIMKLGAFCDSDKYSFTLAFDQVLSRLPKQMLDMFEKGEAVPMPVGGEVTLEEQRKPAFIRRLYLQNLYRFFRLFPQRSDFVDPFVSSHSVFFANGLFHGTVLEKRMIEVASFLNKRHQIADTINVLENVSPENRDLNYHLLWGSISMRKAAKSSFHASEAMDYYQAALDIDPGNRRALMGYARACFAMQEYQKAYDTYEKLLAQQPDHAGAQLNAAACLTNLGRYEEALKPLYKLNYLSPDDEAVMRVLAWTLTLGGKCEQAVKLYDRLLSASQPQPSDLLNYGYCLWLLNDVAGAVGMFRQFLTDQKDESFSMEEELMERERGMLLAHDIGEVEILLMLDYLHQ
jgi:tetratricopeptide (TPR) repeat protein